MSSSSEQHADAAWPHPASEAARGAETWQAPADDYATRADGRSGWAVADPPGAVPPPIAGVEGPQSRPGWLLRGRAPGESDGAA